MKTLYFGSNRLQKNVCLVMTFNQVHYIIDGDDTDTVISIKRDSCWHLNKDGLLRAVEFFDDPRFDYWVNMEYEFCK